MATSITLIVLLRVDYIGYAIYVTYTQLLAESGQTKNEVSIDLINNDIANCVQNTSELSLITVKTKSTGQLYFNF